MESKKIRKCEKKRRKCQHIVEKETGVLCSSIPTKNLVICNSGLVNGLTEEIIIENFIKYGQIENLSMLPGKSCCFISYKEIESAMKAFENIDGQLHIAQDNKPIYLSYTETIPNCNSNRFETPPGLIVIENFITENDEKKLLSLNNFEQESSELKYRFVKHYGYEFLYDINNVNKDKPMEEKIPEECNFLWSRLQTDYSDLPKNILQFHPDQLTVNSYKPGQGIPPHVDTHSAFIDPLISLSLLSSLVMEFKHEDGHRLSVLLPRRSLTIMSGESRYNWTHGIVPRKFDVVPTKNGLTTLHRSTRVSFTFRKVRQGECICEYTTNCDSYKKRINKEKIDDDIAEKLERTHVYDVYENIASHFSDTRHKPWPNVLEFVQTFEIGSVLIDVGCGNGKYFGFNQNIYEIGCDRSFCLIDVCKNRGFQVFTCNCMNLPLRNEIADGVISIAVIHHLASEERRLQAIKEIIRVLTIEGRALIYVWAKNQIIDHQKSSYIKQDRRNRKGNIETASKVPNESICVTDDLKLPVHTNRTQFQHQDILVPWKLKNNISDDSSDNLFLRYYHVFEEGELERLCLKLKNVIVLKSYYDQGNWCVILKKINK